MHPSSHSSIHPSVHSYISSTHPFNHPSNHPSIIHPTIHQPFQRSIHLSISSFTPGMFAPYRYLASSSLWRGSRVVRALYLKNAGSNPVRISFSVLIFMWTSELNKKDNIRYGCVFILQAYVISLQGRLCSSLSLAHFDHTKVSNDDGWIWLLNNWLLEH